MIFIVGLEMLPEQGNEIHQGISYPPKPLDQYLFLQNQQPEQTPPHVITNKNQNS